jgi:uncharacterized protein YgbK (DUF1537 family)
MKPHWAMLADDLTGACDAGVAFSLAGFRTSVVWREDAPWPDDVDLLVISTETRAAGPDEAREKIRRICARLKRQLIYKKIDSVLRGPVEAEILAAMECGRFARAVVCPALPELGRTVRGGRVFLHGEPLDTPLPARDGIETPDAASVDDLRRIAADLASAQQTSLPVGSAGLALELARVLGGRVETRPVPVCEKPIAIIAGSHHAATLAQVDYLREAGTILETTLGGLEHAGRDAFAAVVMREVDETAFEPLGRACRAGRIGGLIATGGATVRVMLNGLDAAGIELCGELDRGIPWGAVRGGPANGVRLITKSGGFGFPDCLWRAWRSLRPD